MTPSNDARGPTTRERRGKRKTEKSIPVTRRTPAAGTDSYLKRGPPWHSSFRPSDHNVDAWLGGRRCGIAARDVTTLLGEPHMQSHGEDGEWPWIPLKSPNCWSPFFGILAGVPPRAANPPLQSRSAWMSHARTHAPNRGVRIGGVRPLRGRA